MSTIDRTESGGTQCLSHQGKVHARDRAFTLIETLVAISLLTIAIVAPITLTVQSLQSAYYSRDQVTAFYLAQEAIEAVRSIRDGQILKIAQGQTGQTLFGSIPQDAPFRIDARTLAITPCSADGGTCKSLETDGIFYGYDSGWTDTNFTRTVVSKFIDDPYDDELRVTVTVSWKTGAYQTRTFSISEDMYKWVPDGAAAR